jgi:hypothetical protein
VCGCDGRRGGSRDTTAEECRRSAKDINSMLTALGAPGEFKQGKYNFVVKNVILVTL